MERTEKHNARGENDPKIPNPNRQEQSDPQLTELKGFVDSDEKLEPMDHEIDQTKEKIKKDE